VLAWRHRSAVGHRRIVGLAAFYVAAYIVVAAAVLIR
jgi:hypothetical protein